MVVHSPPATAGHVTAAAAAVTFVLAMATLASPYVLAFALAAGAAVLAWGWPGALSLPSPRGTLAVIVIGGLALVLAVAGRDSAPWLVWVPAAMSIAMIAAFLHQLTRVDGRPRLLQSVSAVVLALSLVACAVMLIPLAHTHEGRALVVGALAAALASACTDLLGHYPALGSWLIPAAMVAGGAAAVLVVLLMDPSLPWTTWLLLGVATGAVSHAMRAVLAPLPTLAMARPRLVAALASVLVIGVVPYLVALFFVGSAL